MVLENGWEYVDREIGKKIACIVPVFVDVKGDKYIILIKEFRIPLKKYVIGLPAGLVGDVEEGEDLEKGALRELIEETGYSGRIRYLTHGPSSAGLSNEIIHLYMADQLEKVGEGGGDETENIEVISVLESEIKTWLENESKKENCLVDLKVYQGLYFVKVMEDIID